MFQKTGPQNFLLWLCEKCFNINKNWYTQPAYDVIKLQYYKINCSKCCPSVWTHAWSRFVHWYGPCQRWSVGSEPQTLTTSGFSSGRVLASCIRASAWCCCCHGNCTVGTQPISSLSNAVNSQLNADASSEKITHNGPILMKLYRPVLGVHFLKTQCISHQKSPLNKTRLSLESGYNFQKTVLACGKYN